MEKALNLIISIIFVAFVFFAFGIAYNLELLALTCSIIDICMLIIALGYLVYTLPWTENNYVRRKAMNKVAKKAKGW